MKLIITEEDHRFIETIVQRFDPARRLERPASVSEEDWSTFLPPLRGDLRGELEEALIGQALKDAGVIEDVGHIPSGIWTLTRREGENRKSEAWDRAYARVTEGWTSFNEEDAFLAPAVEDALTRDGEKTLDGTNERTLGMAPTAELKAPERPCRGCDATIPAQPRGPGRPREFCSRSCRRAYFHRQEKAEIERERKQQWAEEWERRTFERDVYYHGRREAKRRAKLRARGEPDA